MMKKAIQLKVTIWIEAEDEPAHDFAASTIEAVREVLSTGAKSHPELQMTIKDIVEDAED
jgi:hypothetical protein